MVGPATQRERNKPNYYVVRGRKRANKFTTTYLRT